LISIDEFARKLDGVHQHGKEYSARCPAHDDRKASLCFSEGKDGRILLTCQAGCRTETILDLMGLKFSDITPGKERTTAPERFDFKNVVAMYEYRNGTRKLRDRNKNFYWQHIEGSEWKSKRGDAPHILYAAGAPADVVYLCEGEKDCNNFSEHGFFCVCSEHGADKGGKNKWCSEYSKELAEKEICVLMDNDEVGHKYSEYVANQLVSVSKSVKLLDLSLVWKEMKPKQDISDMLDALGAERTIELVMQLKDSTAPWVVSNTDEVRALLIMAGAKPAATAQNFLTIFRKDQYFSNVRFNVLRDAPEKIVDGKRALWVDTDDARARNYIEREYGVSNAGKYLDAFSEFQHEREYHPVQEIINALSWDGVPRCERFLTDWAGADESPYFREVSRLIFAGGIARAYHPGCKFEDVPVLIGAQGGGKSTLCRWLAMDDDFFAALKTISGQKGNENVQGKWICEIEELLAVLASDKAGTKMDDAVKAYVSGQSDYYRSPYDRRPSEHKRGCILIGTTNRDEFLTDMTGNRRWYPVRCHMNAADLYAHEKECREYIAQCWAEMRTAREQRSPLANPFVKPELVSMVRSMQADAECEDSRVGIVEYYLNGGEHGQPKSITCVPEISIHALKNYGCRKDIPRRESNAIAAILVHKLGWRRGNSVDFKTIDGIVIGSAKSYIRPEK